MTFKVSPGIANHRYTGCRAYFETHTRSLWVCLHLCLCHTWYLLQTPPTQGKGLISHLSPPLGVFVFCPWCYPPLWAVVIRHFFPPVLPSLIFVNDHHQWPSFSISWEFATEIFVETYLWTIFVDNICGQYLWTIIIIDPDLSSKHWYILGICHSKCVFLAKCSCPLLSSQLCTSTSREENSHFKRIFFKNKINFIWQLNLSWAHSCTVQMHKQ